MKDVREHPKTPEHWVEVSGLGYALDLNHPKSAMRFLNIIKEMTEKTEFLKIRRIKK